MPIEVQWTSMDAYGSRAHGLQPFVDPATGASRAHNDQPRQLLRTLLVVEDIEHATISRRAPRDWINSDVLGWFCPTHQAGDPRLRLASSLYMCGCQHICGLSPGHSRGTDSRHQADLGGHGGTPRHGNLSSGGPLRTRWDTRGHATDTVRDREALVVR